MTDWALEGVTRYEFLVGLFIVSFNIWSEFRLLNKRLDKELKT